MGRSTFLITAVMVQLAAGAAMAGPCDGVVEDTLAELRAGSAVPWSDEAEALARAAAGSACVKASSGRYGAEGAPTAQALTSSDGATSTTGMAATADAGKEEGGEGEKTDADDGSWSLGGLTVRSLSGSPAKKPYQRQREQNNDD